MRDTVTNNRSKSCKTIMIRGVYLSVSVWGGVNLLRVRGGGGGCQVVSYRALDLHLLVALPKLLGGLVGISDTHLRGQ